MLVQRTRQGIETTPFRCETVAVDREECIEHCVQLVREYLEGMADSEEWSASRTKKLVARTLAKILADPIELSMFMNATFNERDAKLVYVWAANYIQQHYKVSVCNVTLTRIVEGIKAIEREIEQLLEAE